MSNECSKCKELFILARRLSAGLLLSSSGLLSTSGVLGRDDEMKQEIQILLKDADKLLDIQDLKDNLEVLKAQTGATP